MVAGKIKTYFLGMLSIVLTLNVLFPFAVAYATNTKEEDFDRRRLIAFRECLSNSDYFDRNDEGGNPAENFNDLWQGDSGAGYTTEKIVVGLDMDGDNGTWTCKTAVANGLRVLFPSINTHEEAVTKFVELLIGEGAKLGDDIDTDDLRDNQEALIGRIDRKLTELGPPRHGFTVARLIPLINICFDIKEDSPDLTESGNNFKMKLGDKSYYLEHSSPDDDSFVWLDQGSGSIVNEDYVKLGDIELGFRSGSDGRIGVGRWDSWESDFYPFGSDLPSFTGNHAGNNGVLDCKFIKENRDFFPAHVVLGVDVESDNIQPCVDADNNGSCSQEEAIHVDANPASTLAAQGDDRPTCETTGGNTLSWALCPIINGGAALADWALEAFIVPFLENVPITADSESSIFQAWSSFRVIANILLVGLLLAVALAQGASKG